MKKSLVTAALAFSLICPGGRAALSSGGGLFDTTVIEYETGLTYIIQNDGRYGEEGTRFSAGDVGQQRNLLPVRRVSLELKRGRHSVILLYAPLDLTTFAVLDDDLQFRDTLFPAGTLLEHRYLFDGYRASYLYNAHQGKRTRIDLGGSIQVRNAEVSFRSGDGALFDTENDIGLVFALKGRLRLYPWESGAWIMIEADGFSTFGLLGDEVTGAIYDLRLVFGLPMRPGLDLVLGGRLLGGGAEVRRRNIENWGNYGSFTVGLEADLANLFRRRTSGRTYKRAG